MRCGGDEFGNRDAGGVWEDNAGFIDADHPPFNTITEWILDVNDEKEGIYPR